MRLFPHRFRAEHRWLSPNPLLSSVLRPESVGLSLLLLFLCVGARGQQLFIEKSDASPAMIDAMYVKGLQFLAKSQSAEGAWTDVYGRQPGVIGLAVVAMLAHGDDPNVGP